MLVGDRIISVRRSIPDFPPSLPAPSATITLGGGGTTLPAGNYYAVVTQIVEAGETLPSAETLVAVGAGGSIQATTVRLPGTTAARLYLTMPGGPAGSELAYSQQDITSTTPGSTFTFAPVTAFPLTTATPPTRSSAFLPDADGPQFSAAQLYSWLNKGLNKISYAVGGLLNYGGCPSVAGQPLYVMPGGQWLSVSDVWYGGYWMQGGNRADFFRRNTVTSNVLQALTISVQTDKQVIEVSYQPDRTSGLTSTTGDISATDVGVGIADPSAFLLPFAFARLGVGTNYEFVSYSSLAAGFMSGMVRGLGNTVAQPWPSGTLVTEMGLFWNGRCVFTTEYAPGDSGNPIPVPSGWESIIDDYMLAQAKKGEQDMEGWKQLEDGAFKQAEQWMYANRGVAQRVQVGEPNWPLVYSNTPAGGLLIP